MQPMTPSADALRTLAAYQAVFEAPAFRVGEWRGGERDARGVIEMPYMELSEDAERFVSDMYRVELVQPVDWGGWLSTERGRLLSTDAGAVATATGEELVVLLTAIIRGERFGDGQIEGAFERGLLQAAARRAAALLAEG